MKVDHKRKQVTLYDPSTVGHVSQAHRKMGVAAPKMFAFDSIFESDCSQVSVDDRLVRHNVKCDYFLRSYLTSKEYFIKLDRL